MVEQRVDWAAAAGGRDGERLGDRGRDELGAVHSAEGNKIDAVRELVQDPGRDFRAEAGRAGPAPAGGGRGPGAGGQVLGRADLCGPAESVPTVVAPRVCSPIRTRTEPPSGHSWSYKRFCTAAAPAHASSALSNTMKKESPSVRSSWPPLAASASRWIV